MRDMHKRVEKVERILGMGNMQRKPDVICINERMFSEPEPVLPENVEEWLTYQKQAKNNPDRNLIILFASGELKAKELQKATKSNQKQLKSEKLSQQDE